MMEHIPLYRFYKHKYGKELLVDMLDLEHIKPGIISTPIHRETFYCIIFITGGEENLSVNGHRRIVKSGDVVCSIPGEIWEWQPNTQLKGFVIIFEEDFLLSFFNDLHFLSRFHYLKPDRNSPFLIPEIDLWKRLMQQVESMKQEMEFSLAKDPHILRALLYGTLILLDRAECVSAVFPQTIGSHPIAIQGKQYQSAKVTFLSRLVSTLFGNNWGTLHYQIMYKYGNCRERSQRLFDSL